MRRTEQTRHRTWPLYLAASVVIVLISAGVSVWLGPRAARTWITLPAGVIIGVLLAGKRVKTRSWQERWARDRGATGSPDEQELFDRYLRRQRMAGSFTFGATLIAVLVSKSLTGQPFGFVGVMPALVFIVALYQPLLLVADAVYRPHPASTTRAAALTPRTLADYAEPAIPVALWCASGVTAALAVGFVLVDHRALPFPFDDAGAISVAGAALLVAGGSQWTQKIRIQRPQPFTSPALVRADDINRSASIRGNLYGALIAAVVAIGFEVRAIGETSHTHVFRSALPPVGIGIAFVGGLVLMLIARRAWKVTRPIGEPQAT